MPGQGIATSAFCDPFNTHNPAAMRGLKLPELKCLSSTRTKKCSLRGFDFKDNTVSYIFKK